MTTAQAVESLLRCAMQERDARLRARYAERVIDAGGRRALVTPTGRVLAQQPEGWLPVERVALPAEGGQLVLPSDAPAFAEPVGHEEAFVVRGAEEGRAASRRAVLKLSLLGGDSAVAKLDGREVRLSRRYTEILTLLAAHPEGMTGEELAPGLYGDDGHPSTCASRSGGCASNSGRGWPPSPARDQRGRDDGRDHGRDGLHAAGDDRHRADLQPAGVVAHISEELETKTRILIVPDDVAYYPRARRDLDRSSARAPTRRATRAPSRPRLPTCYASAACWASRSARTGFLSVPFSNELPQGAA